MCYLRHLNSVQNSELTSEKIQEGQEHFIYKTASQLQIMKKILQDPQIKIQGLNQKQYPFSTQQKNMILFEGIKHKIKKNNETMNSLWNKLQECFASNLNVRVIKSPPSDTLIKPSYDLLGKLFKLDAESFNFTYRLLLEKNLPKTIYKSRKLQLSIKLVRNSSRIDIVNNLNPLDICIGVFDDQGNWITEANNGEQILKGVTSTQLTNGRAEFTKVYVREINKNMPNKKFNLGIYLKPGFKSKMNNVSQENIVDWRSVKPLLLKNLTVFSKLKTNYEDSDD